MLELPVGGRTPPPARAAVLPTQDLPPVSDDPVGGWECARLTLRLLAPLVAGEYTSGNAVRSASRLPGRLLLPAVLGMLGVDAAHLAARGGRLVVTDATVDVGGVAGRVPPHVLVAAKDNPRRLYNTLAEPVPAGVRVVEVAGYVGPLTDDGVALAPCPMAEYTHNTISDDVQRPTSAVGGLSRPGFVGDSQPCEGRSHASTEEVPGRGP